MIPLVVFASTQADFLAVSHLTPAWQKGLEGLRTEYP